MKNILILIIVAALTTLTQVAEAQIRLSDQISENTVQAVKTDKYVMLATTVAEFRDALAKAQELNPKKNKYQFEVLISGVLAGDIYKERKDLKKDFKQFDKLGVHMVACEIALDREGAVKNKIHKSIKIIPDTRPYLGELKVDGFKILSHKKAYDNY